MSYKWTTKFWKNTGTPQTPVWVEMILGDVTPYMDDNSPELNISRHKRIDGKTVLHTATNPVSNQLRNISFKYCAVDVWAEWKEIAEDGNQIRIQERMWTDRNNTMYRLETHIGNIESISFNRIAKTVPQKFNIDVTLVVTEYGLGAEVPV